VKWTDGGLRAEIAVLEAEITQLHSSLAEEKIRFVSC
jgi:hypothetical protein